MDTHTGDHRCIRFNLSATTCVCGLHDAIKIYGGYFTGRRQSSGGEFIYSFRKLKVGDIVVFKPPPKAGRTQKFIKRIVGLPGDVIEVKSGRLYRNGDAAPDENYVKRWLFSIDARLQSDLDSKNISESLRQAFADKQSLLSDNATVSVQDEGGRWTITDEDNGETYLIRKDKGYPGLNVYVSEESYSRRKPSTRRGLQNKPPFTVPPGHVFLMGDNRDLSNDSRAWGPVPIKNIAGQAFLIDKK